jgi:hypothetical protein
LAVMENQTEVSGFWEWCYREVVAQHGRPRRGRREQKEQFLCELCYALLIVKYAEKQY